MSDWLPEIRRRLAPAELDPAREAEIAQELAQHLDDRYAEMRALGSGEDEARQAALAELDDDARMRRDLLRSERRESTVPPTGDPGRPPFLQGLWQDVRYAGRMLRRNPGFTALAVLTLALGVGATTVVYAIIDHVLVRAVPYKDIDRLVRLYTTEAKNPSQRIMLSHQDVDDLRARATTLEAVGLYRSGRGMVLLEGEPERVSSGGAGADFFAAAGVGPVLGRGFVEADSVPGAPRVTILSHAAWQRRFGGDPDVVGRVIKTVDGPLEIVGVLESARMFAGSIEFWLPFSQTSMATMRHVRGLWVMGRLRDGATLAEARAEVQAIGTALAAEHPDTNAGTGLTITSMHEATVGHLREPLFTFLGAVGCILLIACINVAGLLIARGAARAKEMAVRVSLGAGRWRLVRQLVTESVVLAIIGGAAGTLLAWWTLASLVPLFPLLLPADRIAVDWRVMAVAIAAAGSTGLLFGILPALGLSRAATAGVLKDQSHTTSRWGRRLGAGLVTIEVALSLVLLGGAGLMVRTLVNLYAVDPGIDVAQVLAVRATPLLPVDAPAARSLEFYRALTERATAVPGVQSASAVSTPPLGGSTTFAMASVGAGRAPAGVSPRSALPGYFATMGIRLTAGRDFTWQDREGAPLAAIVNESAAARLWPAQSPIGRDLFYTGDAPGKAYTVIGVVTDVRHQALDQDVLNEVYHPLAQRPEPDVTVVARVADTAAVAPLLRASMTGLPERFVGALVTPFSDLLDRTTLQRRNRAVLLSVLGGLGVLLASVGVFGVTAFSVTQRTKEIGVRIALGADGPRVLRTIIGSQVTPIALGVVLGILCSWWATRVLTTYLFGVEPTDLVTFAAVAAIITTVGLTASYIPARRVLRLDPVAALRAE
ncbi:ABC transporter permease [soil metagenome]